MQVLIIEDNKLTLDAMQKSLKDSGILVSGVCNGHAALEMLNVYKYDVVIIDIILDDMSGYELIEKIRSMRKSVAILVVSGLAKVTDRIHALEIGADDYLIKPAYGEEIAARVMTIFRRCHGYADATIQIGSIIINTVNKTASCDGNILKLTRREYSILELLALRKNSTLEKDAFINFIYGGAIQDMKIIDVFVCKLRKKLEEIENSNIKIETVWGVGYKLIDYTTQNTAHTSQRLYYPPMQSNSPIIMQ